MAFDPNNPNGRAAAANSSPQVLSTEDKAVLDSIDSKILAAGQRPNAGSSPVTLSSEQQALITGLALDTSVKEITGAIGINTESAASSDTATSGLNGLFKRLLQRITSLIGLFPTSLSGSGNFKTAVSEALPAGTNNIGDVDILSQLQSYGANNSLSVSSLNSLASSTTAGWLSGRIENLVNKASDYLVGIKLAMANTVPGSDKTAYVWVVPWFTPDGGTNWYPATGGVTAVPGATQAAYTFALVNDFRLLGTLAYNTQNQVLQGNWYLSRVFGNKMPHGFSIFITNATGAALLSSGNIVYVQPVS